MHSIHVGYFYCTHRPYSYHRQSFQSATYKTGGGYWTRSDEFCEYPLLEKLHFHVALEEVRVTELLSYRMNKDQPPQRTKSTSEIGSGPPDAQAHSDCRGHPDVLYRPTVERIRVSANRPECHGYNLRDFIHRNLASWLRLVGLLGLLRTFRYVISGSGYIDGTTESRKRAVRRFTRRLLLDKGVLHYREGDGKRRRQQRDATVNFAVYPRRLCGRLPLRKRQNPRRGV